MDKISRSTLQSSNIDPDSLPPLTRHLVEEEGIRCKPYPCSSGKLTIGVGRNIEDTGITVEEAFYLLDNNIKEGYLSARRLIKDFDSIDEVRQAAIISMIFQLGEVGFSKFHTTIRHLNSRDYDAAATSASQSLWARQTPERAKRVAEMIRTGRLCLP